MSTQAYEIYLPRLGERFEKSGRRRSVVLGVHVYVVGSDMQNVRSNQCALLDLVFSGF